MERRVSERSFRMHSKLLVDVIRKQAGTLEKAILEGVMNSVESCASRVDIILEAPDKITIIDDGRGFQSREEIVQCFETFGTPHDKKENKIWARFRMGRGQLFAFGRNKWRTNTYLMEVDIEGSLAGNADASNPYGISYKLTEDLPPADGCRIDIELYELRDESFFRRLAQETAMEIKYVKVPVYINGKRVSIDPATKKWDIENDDAYIRFSSSDHNGLKIYNLGCYVLTDYNMGSSGEIVSKKRLDVNFARNQIIASCPVWRSIRKTVQGKMSVNLCNKRRLNEEERRHLIRGLMDGEYRGTELSRSPLFPDVTGKYWSAAQIGRIYNRAWSYDRLGSRKGDRAMQLEVGIVLDVAVMSMFGYRGESKGFFEYISSRYNLYTGLTSEKYTEVTRMLAGLDDAHTILPRDKCTKREQLMLTCMGSNLYGLISDYRTFKREFRIGLSDMYEGWTDGVTYIAISRKFIKKMRCDLPSFTRLAFLVLHELFHNSPDTEDAHIHTPEFYRDYHDSTDKAIVSSGRMYSWYVSRLRKESLRIAKEERLRQERERKDEQLRKLDPDAQGEIGYRSSCTG